MTSLPIRVPAAPTDEMISAGVTALRAVANIRKDMADSAVRRIYVGMLAAFLAQPIPEWSEAADQMATALDLAGLAEMGWTQPEIEHAIKAVGEPSRVSRDQIATIWPLIQALVLGGKV